MRKVVWPFIILVFLAACSPYGGRLKHSYTENDTRIQDKPIHTGWKIPFDGGDSRPVIEQGIIYIGSETGVVHAVDANTGEIIWKFQQGTKGEPGPTIIESDKGDVQSMIAAAHNMVAEGQHKIKATPIIDDGIVYIGSLDLHMYAINAKSGQMVWSAKLGEIRDRAQVAGESIIVHVRGPRTLQWFPRIRVLDRKGGIRWSTPDDQMATYPTIDKNNIYYSLFQPKTEGQSPFFSLYSADLKTGKALWVTKLKGKRPYTAVIAAGRIYVTAFEGGEIIQVPGGVSSAPKTIHLYALEVENGKLLWDVTAGEPVLTDAPITVGQNLLFIATGEGLQAFDRTTGNRRWIIREDFSPYNLHVGRYLYALKGGFGEDSTLEALSLQDGKQIWSAKLGNTGHNIYTKEGVLYVTAYKDLFAFDSATGKRLWKFTTWSFFNPGTRITTAPEIYQGQLIFPSVTQTFFGKSPIQGYLYSIDLETGEMN